MPAITDLADYQCYYAADGRFDRMQWYADIEIEWGRLDIVVAWLANVERGAVLWEMLNAPATRVAGHYRFFFANECDYTLFLITWS